MNNSTSRVPGRPHSLAAALCALIFSVAAAAHADPPTYKYTVSLLDSGNGVTGKAILFGSDLDGDGTIFGDGGKPGNEWQYAYYSLNDNGSPFVGFTDVAGGVILNPAFTASATPGVADLSALQGIVPLIDQPYQNAILYTPFDAVWFDASVPPIYGGTPFGGVKETVSQLTLSQVPEPGAIAFGVLASASVIGLVARRRRG